jgi:cytochrome P450
MPETVTKTPEKAAGKPNLPPGPKGELMAGNGRQFQKDPIQFLMSVQRDYGNTTRFRLGRWNFYLYAQPEDIREILVEHDERFGGFLVDNVVSQVLGHSLFMSEGDTWRRHRRMIQPGFHRDRVAPVGPITVDMALELLDQWRPLEAGTQLNMLKEMMALTLRVAAKSLFGMTIREDARVATQAVTDIFDHFAWRIQRMPFVPPPWLPTAQNRHFTAALATLEAVVERMVAERRADPNPPDDFLTMLLNAEDRDTGYRMDDRQIRDEVMAMVIMSHESTADTICFTWMLLGQHPEVEERLHAELRDVLGTRPPTMDDIPRLTYTRQVIEETMRLYPPGWMLGRRALVDCHVGGYDVPARTVVLFSPYVTHRLPELWPDPERFDPDRFGPGRAERRHRFAYYPFGGGPHVCIGSNFAMIESQLAVATLAQHCRPRLVPGHQVALDALITLRPRGGMPMTVEWR